MNDINIKSLSILLGKNNGCLLHISNVETLIFENINFNFNKINSSFL